MEPSATLKRLARPLSTDDYELRDEQDAVRLRELACLIRTGEDPERVQTLIAELIMGWRPHYLAWLEVRFGPDIAQEVDARALEKLTRLLLRKQTFDQPWGAVVWANVKRYALGDELRERARRSPEVAAEDPSMLAAGPSATDPLTEAEFEAAEGPEVDTARLDQALNQLSPSDRELIEMLFFDNVGRAQAATKLGIKPGTLSVRKLRALKRLREAWD